MIGGLKLTEIERNNRISEEIERISGFFEKLPKNKLSIISPLIRNAAFMRVTLDDLQETIARDGPVDHYQNGANQSGTKQSAALQGYIALQKTYLQTVKSLAEYLPPEKKVSPQDIAYQEARARADAYAADQKAKRHRAWIEEERKRAEEEGRGFDLEALEEEARNRPEWEQEQIEHRVVLDAEIARAKRQRGIQ